MATKLEFRREEMVTREGKKKKRYPNLNTVLMVENLLKEHQDKPMKVAEIKKKLPKKIMHSTLMIIFDYLQLSGKIIIGTKGVQWIYAPPEQIRKMLEGGLEL